MDSTQQTPSPEQSTEAAADSKFECCGASDDINERLNSGKDRMDKLEESMESIRKDTAEVLEIIILGKSFFKLAGYLGTFVRWSAGIGAPLLALYFTIKGTK